MEELRGLENQLLKQQGEYVFNTFILNELKGLSINTEDNTINSSTQSLKDLAMGWFTKILIRLWQQMIKKMIKYFQDFIVRCLSSYIDKLIPYFVGTVYRAVEMSTDDIRQYNPGVMIMFPSFASTSKSLEKMLFLGKNTLFIMKTLSAIQQENLFMNTNADLHISGISVFGDAEEVLYPPFSTFYVHFVEKKEHDSRMLTFITLEANDLSACMHLMLRSKQNRIDRSMENDIEENDNENPPIFINL